jgi:spermidine synthase
VDKTGIVRALTIVFVSSFCSMALELVAGRLLAPYIGVSLYTSTSIIGVVLAGISVGNFVGGRLADRAPAESTLGWILFLAGMTTLLIVPVTQIVVDANVQLPLVAKIIAFTAAIFFIPCLLMGMVSPLVVKLTLRSIEKTGSTIGAIYAFSTLGSIVGTFATGFVLISTLGTRVIVALVAVTLILMSLILTRLGRSKATAVLMLACLLATGALLVRRDLLVNPCLLETDYYCIKVTDGQSSDGRPMKLLILDHLVHSFVMLDDPTHLEYSYEKVYAEVARYISPDGGAIKALFIGGGGYTFPRYLEATYRGSTLDVLEIDPAVTKVAYQYLGLPVTSTIHTSNGDARQYLMQSVPTGDYDLILGDAFNDLSVPYHLTTKEFSALVKRYLRDSGLYIVNVIDHYSQGSFLKAFAYTLSQVFPYVYITADGPAWEWGHSTFVVVGASHPIDPARFASIQQMAGQEPRTRFLPPEMMAQYLQQDAVLLTDDYVPVDNMIARLFVERGF